MGADVEEPVIISGMAICVVLPSREGIEEISEKLAEGGTLVQGFLPHPLPDKDDGGADELDNFKCKSSDMKKSVLKCFK